MSFTIHHYQRDVHFPALTPFTVYYPSTCTSTLSSLAHLVSARLKRFIVERKVMAEEKDAERKREAERRKRLKLEREADPALRHHRKMKDGDMYGEGGFVEPTVSSFLSQNLGDSALCVYSANNICFYVFHQGKYLLLKSNTTPMNVVYGLYDPGKPLTSPNSVLSTSRSSAQASYPSVLLLYALKVR
jgi:hypothetical protein